ncbi:MAG: M16 family metallopeptidase [Rhodoferax sp.]
MQNQHTMMGLPSRLAWLAQRALCFLLLAPCARAALPIEHWTHTNGAQVYLVQSPGIPMVDVQIDFDAGDRRSPPGKTGLPALMAAATRNGVQAARGQSALDENALGEAWADLGASFTATAGDDRLTFSLRSLSYPDLLAQAGALAARQMGEPAFPEKLWLRDRPKTLAGIQESYTRAANVAARAFRSAVYGSHPYGLEMTESDLNHISTDDMQTLHAALVRACYARLSIVGALDRPQADALVSTLLARMPQGPCPALPPVPEVQPLTKAVEQRIAFDAAQAHVLVGQPGIKRSSPDFFALLVGNHILGGGGFTARLTEELREKRGLTYSVYSSFAPGLHAGAFTIGLQTRPDQAQQALDLVRAELVRFVAQGPTEKELQAAKDHLVGGFALRIDSNRKLLDNVANIAWNDLPLDYLSTWTDQVQGISARDIRQAFARTLSPPTMATIVLGGK